MAVAFWLTLAPLLAPVVSVATIGGIVIALIQLQVVLRNRRIDLAATRFDHTIQAYEFYQNNVAEILDKTITQYQSELRQGNYQQFKNQRLGKSVIARAMLIADFGACFRKLNLLESYVYYDEIDKLQLYSSIADHVYRLTQIDGFEVVKNYYLQDNVMNNYIFLLDDIEKYVTERRATHGRNREKD